MIAITHPIKQLINSQYGVLSSMLDFYPNLMNEWIHKQEEEVEQLAREFAEGDAEVYRDTYSSEISRIDSCYDEEQLFNQAMLIMVYSYYESSLLRFAKEKGIDPPRPSVIANHFGKDLDEELLKISNYLYDYIEPLRNQLCHNNQGTLFAKKDKRRKAQIERFDKLIERKFITVDDGRIVSIDRTFIKNILDGEHQLLLYLSEICGFRTQWCLFKDGKMLIYDSYEEFMKQKVEL